MGDSRFCCYCKAKPRANNLPAVRPPPLPLSLPCRYVVGDSRFSRYCKSNPRKMVKMWAEKEMRNLARLHAAGIRCPKPLQLRMHVLGEWVGGGWRVGGGQERGCSICCR